MLERNDFARAILEFKNAVQAVPSDAEPHYRLGLAYAAANDFRMATGSYQKAAELNPRHVEAKLKLAEIMSWSSDRAMVERAAVVAADALKLAPGNVAALEILAQSEFRLGKTESAAAHLQEVLVKQPDRLQTSAALARARIAAGDAKGAERVLRDAVMRAPNSAEAAVQLGEFYIAAGRTTDGEQSLRRALSIDANYGPALLDLAALQARAGQAQEADDTYRRAAALPDRRYKSAHALFLWQSGKASEAITELEALARGDPADRAARTRLVDAYKEVRRFADAEAVLNSALKRNPRDADALLERGRVYLVSGRYAQSESDLNEVIRTGTRAAEARYLLSRVHQARNEPANQKQALEHALQLDATLLAARLELARLFTTTQSPGAALQLLEHAPEEQKSLLPVLLERNWAHLTLGEEEKAKEGIARALALGGGAEARLQDATLRLQRRDFDGARNAAQAALKTEPENLRALDMLMRADAAQPGSRAGWQMVKEHAGRQPGSAAVHQFLGRVLLARGDRMEARQAFERARANDPKLVAASLALAELDIGDGKLDAARASLAAILSEHSDNIVAHLFLADIAHREGNRAAAISRYRRVLEIEPGNVLALNDLAYLLAEAGHADEALRFAQRAKQSAPENATVDDTLGWAYYQKGSYKLAAAHLENAVNREATARRKYHLAMAYLKSGDVTRGRRTLDAALEEDQTLPESAAARELFGLAAVK